MGTKTALAAAAIIALHAADALACVGPGCGTLRAAPLQLAHVAMQGVFDHAKENLTEAHNTDLDWAAMLVLSPYGEEKIEVPANPSTKELRRFLKDRAEFWGTVSKAFQDESQRLDERQAELTERFSREPERALQGGLEALEDVAAQKAANEKLGRHAAEVAADAARDRDFGEARLDGRETGETNAQVRDRKIALFTSLARRGNKKTR